MDAFAVRTRTTRRSRNLVNQRRRIGQSTFLSEMARQWLCRRPLPCRPTAIVPDLLVEVQRLAVRQHKTAAGPRLCDADVRAAMLLRANSLLKGASGIRLEVIERCVTFLNAGASPHVY